MFRARDVVVPANRRRSGQSGMGLIELMIAMVVLMVGMLGSMIMVIAGMQSNTRNRNDTSAVVLDQEILEKFATLKNYPKTGTASIYDCALAGTNQHLAGSRSGSVYGGHRTHAGAGGRRGLDSAHSGSGHGRGARVRDAVSHVQQRSL
jgi:Tfp pilus assembly protein PilV